MIKAVAWDIDGTLVDSEPLHLFALKEVCRQYSVDISDLEDSHFIGVHIGNVWRELQARFPADITFDNWAKQLNTAYSENCSRLTEISHASAVIRQLAAMGLRQIAVSNSNRLVVNANLDAIGVADIFEASISLDDVSEGKPAPLPYLLACSRLAIEPSEVLAVEDSATGVVSALAAKMPVAYLYAPSSVGNQSIYPITHLSEVLELVKMTKPHYY